MASHVKKWVVESNGTTRQYEKTYTGTGETRIDGETVADAVTDQLLAINIDVSAVKSFYIVADGGALTVETNDGTTPTDTLSLASGRPYVWDTDSEDSFLLTADVTAMYLTNASGGTVTLHIECIYDASP